MRCERVMRPLAMVTGWKSFEELRCSADAEAEAQEALPGVGREDAMMSFGTS